MAKQNRPTPRRVPNTPKADSYRHPEADSPLRPEVGTQPKFKKKKPPVTYRYDSSLSPALEWDGQNGARDLADFLLGCIRDAARLPAPHVFDSPRELMLNDGTIRAAVRGLEDAVDQLAALGKPFLNWAGKAERLSFDVPTLPLFVHERLSTAGIIETLKGHRKPADVQLDLFGDPQHPISDQLLRAYEYRDKWVNRMILGDSLVVMSSLLHYEGLAGQVQTIYMDPPYGVKFGSNFQPFVRKREVKHNDDDDMTREPEMVKAYRDTWELGLHSYLTYMRDRLLLARELLTPSGSIFVQISDENLHHVRELMDEVFGSDCRVVTIPFKKKGSQKSDLLDPINDYLLWYSRQPRTSGGVRFHQLFERRELDREAVLEFKYVQLPDGREFAVGETPGPDGETRDYRNKVEDLFADWPGARLFRSNPLTSGGERKNQSLPYEFKGRVYNPGVGNCWKTTVRSDSGVPGMKRLEDAGRLFAGKNQLRFKSFYDDFGFSPISNWWDGFGGASDPVYVVQTNREIIQRCILMTSKPGDLVLDPTCGSGTTAYVAEQWGRRWITIDASRVPLALARQRLLTATFSWYDLKDEARGPVGGFDYKARLNGRGEEVGGIVKHVTLEQIANDEPPEAAVLVDRPEVKAGIVRVSGPFVVEATIPTPVDWEGDGEEDIGVAAAESHGSFVERMLEVLRRSPVLHLGAGKTVTLRNVRIPAKTLTLSAEAQVEATAEGQRPSIAEAVEEAAEKNKRNLPFSMQPVAIAFGPENGSVSEKLVYEAGKEANAKRYTHLYVIGFAIQPDARKLVETCEEALGIPATYVQATPDLMMGDLLKNMRSSQIFSVCGLPDVELKQAGDAKPGKELRYVVTLRGLDVFDPSTMATIPLKGEQVPAWFLDTDYNGLCFHVCQAFFPRTSAWEGLKKALKATYSESVWDHLAGTKSAPFEGGEHGEVAVKVIDDRGNELMVVKKLTEARR